LSATKTPAAQSLPRKPKAAAALPAKRRNADGSAADVPRAKQPAPARRRGSAGAALTTGGADAPPTLAAAAAAASYLEIAEAAYFRAQLRGFAPGHELDDWLAAESDLKAGRRAAAAPAQVEPIASRRRSPNRRA